MPDSEDKTKIDRLKDTLYSRNFTPESPYERSGFHKGESPSIEEDWKQKESVDELLKPDTPLKKRSILKIVFWTAVMFFVASVATAIYMFYGGGVIVSSRNVDISIVGPISIPGGETLTLDVVIHNKNNVPLEGASLSVTYPPGTRVPEALETELLRERHELGTIAAGGVLKKTLKAVLFGETEAVKQTQLSLEYRVSGSSALFETKKNYDVSISLSPVTVIATYPKEVNANQEFEISLSLASNSSTIIRKLLLEAQYPFGFRFKEGSPAPSFDDNVWLVGDLEPGGKRIIALKGVLQGQNEEERTFRFEVGSASGEDKKHIGVSFLSTFESVLIKKPFVELSLKIAFDDSAGFVAPMGTKIPIELDWFNTLPVNVLNAVIEVKLLGAALDRTSVSAQGGGFYRSIDNTIVWDKKSTPTLSELGPRKAGGVDFSFNLLPISGNVLALRNPEVLVEAILRGTRFADDGAPEEVVSTATKVIKVASNLSLNSRLVYTAGPFDNSGPLPPKAETETSYTVIWSVNNAFNRVSGATVHASLPPYISWLGVISPESEKISYDAQNREVIWNLGDIENGTGVTRPAREVSFQISFLPSLGQLDSIPVIVNTTTLSGQDRFTNTTLESSALPLTTWLSTDPGVQPGHERVRQ